MAADTVAVLLLQPTKVGGKRQPEGTKLDVPADLVDSLVQSGAAELVQAKSGSKKATGPAPAAG